MTHRLVTLLFGATLVGGLCACPVSPGPTPDSSDTTLRLNRLSNGDVEYCDAALYRQPDAGKQLDAADGVDHQLSRKRKRLGRRGGDDE